MAGTNGSSKWLNSPIVAALVAALLAGLTMGVVALTTLSVETSTRISTIEKQFEERAASFREVLVKMEARYNQSIERTADRLDVGEARLRQLELNEVSIKAQLEDVSQAIDEAARLVSRIEVLEDFRTAMNAYLGDLVSDVQAKEYRRMNQEELDRRLRSYTNKPENDGR